MPRSESVEIDAALPPPGYSTPTNPIRNDGAAHAESNAERMETDSEADVEKEFGESMGKKRCWSPYLQNNQGVDHRPDSNQGG